MGCGGDLVFCDLLDIGFAIINAILGDCCKWEKGALIKFLPRFLICASFDLFAIVLMITTTCVYYDGEEYFQGKKNYSFSFDVIEVLNLCYVNETTRTQNVTEVTDHAAYSYAGFIWFILACLYAAMWIIFYIYLVIRSTIETCLSFCCKRDEYKCGLGVIQYKVALGAMKLLNIMATAIVVSKGIILVVYVEPSPLEWIIFLLSIVDGLLCSYELVSLIILIITVHTKEGLKRAEKCGVIELIKYGCKQGCKCRVRASSWHCQIFKRSC